MGNRVVIIGGGFAGLAAARRIARAKGDVVCTLIDRKCSLDFLPMVPELLSRRVGPGLLQYDLAGLADRIGFRFLRAEVTAVNLENRTVTVTGVPSPLGGEGQGEGVRLVEESIPYDYLVIASGSETDFHGRDDLRVRAFVIDSVEDALRARRAAESGDIETVVIVGGGYTGIECATHLRRHFVRRGRPKGIMVVEVSPAVVASLPPWVRRYVASNLRRMDVEVAARTSVTDFADGVARLSDGRTVPRAMLVWTAGVRTPAFVRALEVDRCRQGRIKVDEYLRVTGTCFAAGDAACVTPPGGKPLRMAVQIALDEGTCAGENVLRSIRTRPLARYRPLDLGWVVPMANLRSCGFVLGFGVRGLAASMLHYLMCLYRSTGPARRIRMLGQIISRRG